jgi:hypothetical protein
MQSSHAIRQFEGKQMKVLHLGRIQMAALNRKNNSRFNRSAGTLQRRNRSAQLRENN